MDKKFLKGILTGFLMCTIITGVSFATGITQSIQVTLNKINVSVNGTELASDNILYNGTTYVPIRKVAESLNKYVGYDPNTNTAIISNDPVVIKSSTTPSGEDYIVTFGDESIEKIIRAEIDKPKGDIYKSEVEKITFLNLTGHRVASLQGVENLTGLTMINLGGNIVNREPIKNLPSLNLTMDR